MAKKEEEEEEIEKRIYPNRAMLMDAAVYLVGFLHIIVSPYTKVEESFNLQAIHDIMYHRAELQNYDHNEFPGVVPRTFIGPLVVSAASSPLVFLSNFLQLEKIYSQYIVRGVLCALVVAAFNTFSKAVQSRYGLNTGLWLGFLTISQFHFLFYASRPLPNTFALVLTLLAFSAYVLNQTNRFVLLSAAAILIFRAELAGLLGLMLLYELFIGEATTSKATTNLYTRLKEVICYGLVALAVFIPLTVLVDSYFWGRLLWPELEVLYFNTVLNKSSEWGSLPWAWYFYSALPRALLSSLLLVPLAPFFDRRSLRFLLPGVVFILLYSFLPHKELRFIIYTIPLLNTCCALALNYLFNRRGKSWFWSLMALAAIVSLSLNALVTVGLSYVSSANYPGGQALRLLHSQPNLRDVAVNVHLDNSACQTGVSRFGESFDHWTYDKTENLIAKDLLSRGYSHLILQASRLDEMSAVKEKFESIGVVGGLDELKQNWPFRFPKMSLTNTSLLILQRRQS